MRKFRDLLLTAFTYRILFFVVIVLALTSVDVLVSTTNDTVGYLSHLKNLRDEGFIRAGYRQAGYPIFFYFAGNIGDLLGTDILFSIVLCQRLLLFFALLFAVFLLPLSCATFAIVFCANPMVVNLTNRLYPEGILVPLALMIG